MDASVATQKILCIQFKLKTAGLNKDTEDHRLHLIWIPTEKDTTREVGAQAHQDIKKDMRFQSHTNTT